MSLHLSHPYNPLSIHLLLFDLQSPQPLLPLSLGFGCGEVSLSLMTVGLLPARPPLCPQPAQLSRETEVQGLGDPPNKPQEHFSESVFCYVARDTYLKFTTTVSPSISYMFIVFTFIVAPGNMAQRPYSKYGHLAPQCTLCSGYIFPGGIWIGRKKMPSG